MDPPSKGPRSIKWGAAEGRWEREKKSLSEREIGSESPKFSAPVELGGGF